jgi:hypothetical protein
MHEAQGSIPCSSVLPVTQETRVQFPALEFSFCIHKGRHPVLRRRIATNGTNQAWKSKFILNFFEPPDWAPPQFFFLFVGQPAAFMYTKRELQGRELNPCLLRDRQDRGAGYRSLCLMHGNPNSFLRILLCWIFQVIQRKGDS